MYDQSIIDNFVADILYAKREYEWKWNNTEEKKADTGIEKKYELHFMKMQKDRYMKSFRDYVEGENKKEKQRRGGGEDEDGDDLLEDRGVTVVGGQIDGAIGGNGGNNETAATGGA